MTVPRRTFLKKLAGLAGALALAPFAKVLPKGEPLALDVPLTVEKIKEAREVLLSHEQTWEDIYRIQNPYLGFNWSPPLNTFSYGSNSPTQIKGTTVHYEWVDEEPPKTWPWLERSEVVGGTTFWHST